MRSNKNVSMKQVKHPYIVKNKAIRGGKPTIQGSGVRVMTPKTFLEN